MVDFSNDTHEGGALRKELKFLRVGFVYIDPSVWMGGYNYYINLFSALSQYSPGKIIPVLFVPESIDVEIAMFLANIKDLEVIKTTFIEDNKSFFSLCKSIFWGVDTKLVSLLKTHKIDIFFENARYIGWRIGLPVIAWIPDLQHKFLPKYFSWAQLLRREIGFKFQIWSGRHIILSSFDAKNAFERFYKINSKRISVVRFAVPISCEKGNNANVIKKYGLRECFVYMPNQFWLHKNHALAVEALKLFNASNVDKLQIVCTGNTINSRHPEYFEMLEKTIAEYNLVDSFKILGVIPKADVEALIKSARMVLNPSLFEGWSTTVEEFRASRSLMLLSDISVHKEQMEEQALYFDSTSAHDLAEKLDLIINKGLSHGVADEHDNVQRMQRFADDFVSAVKKSLKYTV